jgi:hypothetical protein
VNVELPDLEAETPGEEDAHKSMMQPARDPNYVTLLERNIAYKRQEMLKLQDQHRAMAKCVDALRRRVDALAHEKAGKEELIRMLRRHLEHRPRSREGYVEHLELQLLEALGRVDAETDRWSQCGWGCETCDEKLLEEMFLE